MRNKKINKIMNKIGQREGISSAEVKREIQHAIDLGFDNPDESVQEAWMKIPFKGTRPTVEEVIMYMSKEIKKKQ